MEKMPLSLAALMRDVPLALYWSQGMSLPAGLSCLTTDSTGT